MKSIAALVLLVLSSLAGEAVLANCLVGDSSESDFPDSLVSVKTIAGIQSAWYDDATARYTHGVLGDAIEPSTLVVQDNNECNRSVILDDAHVFEDIAPRLADVDGTSGVEVVTVRSHRYQGAQLAIYQLTGNELKLLTTTPYIGTRNRWLAPVGIADFNNDGYVDIAFVDRPHLAKVLRVWSYRAGKLEQIASETGYSNHRIGEAFISGGLKICQGKTTMITADATWKRIVETALNANELVSEDVGAFTGAQSLSRAQSC